MPRIGLLFCLLALLFSTNTIQAQSLLVHSYTTEQGLPSPEVYSLAEDAAGNIWFATNAGIASFDGFEWTVFGSYVDLPARRYTSVRTSPDGRVWALAPFTEQPLAVWDGRQWSFAEVPPVLMSTWNLTAFEVAEDSSGTVLAVGTDGAGLWVRRNGAWTAYRSADRLPGSGVRGIATVSEGFVVATERGLVSIRNGVFDSSLSEVLPDGRNELLAVAAVGEDENGGGSTQVWVASSTWLGVVDDGEFELVSDQVRLHHDRALPVVLLPDPPRSVYLGGRAVLARIGLADGEVELLGRRNGLVNEGATALLLDNEHNLWVAGLRGVSKIPSFRFLTFRREHGLLDDEVTAICEPQPGRMIFGHNYGLTIRTGGVFEEIPFPRAHRGEYPNQRVLDMTVGPQGEVWIAATDLGLGRMDVGGRLRWYGVEEGLSVPVTAVVIGEDGLPTLATAQGLFRFDGRVFQRLERWNRAFPFVRRMLVDGRRILLTTATTAGPYVVESGSMTELPSTEPVFGGSYSVHRSTDGRVWVGSAVGVMELRDGVVVRPIERELRINRPIFAVTEDLGGNLWFGTDNGVLRWNGSTVEHLAVRDGLAGREINRAAMIADSAGQLWIGTDAGVSVVRIGEEEPQPPPPTVRFFGVDVGDETLAGSPEIVLPYDAGALVFHYGAASFKDERLVRYRTWLEGYEADWSNERPAHERSVRYTNLPPGRYRFHVRAANAKGSWSEAVQSDWIIVSDPFWTRWWFFLVAGAAIGLVAYWSVALVLRWRYAARLEVEVERRTTDLEETETRYRQLFDHEALARLLLDIEQDQVVDANAPAAALCGLPLERTRGIRLSELEVHWLDELVSRWDPQQGSLHFVDRRDLVAGRGTDIELWAGEVEIQKRRLVLVAAHDVSEHRRLEEEQLRASKLESLGLLAGGVAHDFNNLLAAALGKVLLAELRASEGRDVAPLLKNTGENLLKAKRLTDQLLTLSRGATSIPEVVDVGAVVHDAINFVKTTCRASWQVGIASDLWSAEIDEGQIGQVLMNLMLNADQSMPSGGAIRVLAENLTITEDDPHLESGQYVEITVADQGVGITPEIRDRIFDPYFTTRKNGTGLGLATAYAIVGRHGGRITVDSVLGRGSAFTVVLPAAPGAEPGTEHDSGRLARGQGRILAMDDEADLRDLYRDALSLLGYQVTVVGDGGAVVAAYREALDAERPFSVVIMDLTVPEGMGGREAIEELQRVDPKVRAIVASGYARDPVMADYRAAGFAAAIAKPFTISELSKLIRSVTVDQN